EHLSDVELERLAQREPTLACAFSGTRVDPFGHLAQQLLRAPAGTSHGPRARTGRADLDLDQLPGDACTHDESPGAGAPHDNPEAAVVRVPVVRLRRILGWSECGQRLLGELDLHGFS